MGFFFNRTIDLPNVSGADHERSYNPVVTSYDYDAPLSEAGDPTDKLLAIRDVIRMVFLTQTVI